MGNISDVNLLPVDLVSQFSARNGQALGRIHEWFADVVPQIFAEMETRHPDGRIDGGVFSANVRDAFLLEVESAAYNVDGLVATPRPFRSVRFTDGRGWNCRVHMHPKSLKSGRYLSTSPLPDTLFGEAVDAMHCELAILWRPSRRSKALKSICLAAVANLDERNRTTIFASAPLPPVGMSSYWTPQVTEQYDEPMDDFDDHFDEGESFGDDPA